MKKMCRLKNEPPDNRLLAVVSDPCGACGDGLVEKKILESNVRTNEKGKNMRYVVRLDFFSSKTIYVGLPNTFRGRNVG